MSFISRCLSTKWYVLSITQAFAYRLWKLHFFSLKEIMLVSTWQVTYSGSCMNINYTSDLPRQCRQANTVTPFYRSFASDVKTEEQVTLRATAGTEDLIHACSWPVLQPLLRILSFLCSLKSGRCVCSAASWHVPTAGVPCAAEPFGVWCWSHTGPVASERGSFRMDGG